MSGLHSSFLIRPPSLLLSLAITHTHPFSMMILIQFLLDTRLSLSQFRLTCQGRMCNRFIVCGEGGELTLGLLDEREMGMDVDGEGSFVCE